MHQLSKVPKPRVKKRIPEMIPVKKWLTLDEACAYMDMSKSSFIDMVRNNGLTVSVMGDKKRYKVAELEELIEANILIKKIS